jgi:hypothetical protein
LSAADPKYGLSAEQLSILGPLLDRAIPLAPTGGGTYVTREEFDAALNMIESKIENSSLRQRNWVLAGCIAVMLAFGGGYISLMSKLDRLTDALPTLAAKTDARGPWIQRQERRDTMQDEALRKLDREYQPLPYQEPPQ